MSVDDILEANSSAFEEMSNKVKNGADYLEVARQYRSFGDKIGVGDLGLMTYIAEYIKRKQQD